MKYRIYLFLLTIISCQNQQQEVGSAGSTIFSTSTTLKDANTDNENEICWTGTLNRVTPIFIHYHLYSNLITGEIIYLNEKDKLPITLLGTIKDDRSYRLLEFEKSGNITGIITRTTTDGMFKGSWFSPVTKKELALNLVKKDTVMKAKKTETRLQDIFGHYHYQYGEAGYQGDFEISKLPCNKAVFSITSVTGEPARNLAHIDDDTIILNSTQFIYKIPGSEKCEFSVNFHKKFIYIKYTKGLCEGQFGMNATIEGIYFED